MSQCACRGCDKGELAFQIPLEMYQLVRKITYKVSELLTKKLETGGTETTF